MNTEESDTYVVGKKYRIVDHPNGWYSIAENALPALCLTPRLRWGKAFERFQKMERSQKSAWAEIQEDVPPSLGRV